MINGQNNLNVYILNCKSIRNKLGEIKLMLYRKKPEVLCVTETWITNKRYEPKFINYVDTWEHRLADNAGGGLGIIIRQDVVYQNVVLQKYQNGGFEIQAVKVFREDGRDIIIANVYNAGQNIKESELQYYIKQLGRYYMIVGDFNAHSHILDSECVQANVTGKSI